MAKLKDINLRPAWLAFGTLLSPLDSLRGLLWGAFWWAKATYDTRSPLTYFYSIFNETRNLAVEKNPEKDRRGKITSGAFSLSRIGGICLTAVCVAGFLGALAFPLPGTAPLYALTVGSVCKAAGITIAWSSAGRMLGALVGAVVDKFKLSSIFNRHFGFLQNDPQQADKAEGVNKKLISSASHVKRACLLGLFGEAGPVNPPRKNKVASKIFVPQSGPIILVQEEESDTVIQARSRRSGLFSGSQPKRKDDNLSSSPVYDATPQIKIF